MGKNNKKGKKRSGGGGGGGGGDTKGGTTIWDGTEHVIRRHHQAKKKAKKMERQEEGLDQDQPPPKALQKLQDKEERRQRLTEKRTHNSKDKREAAKLRLNIIKTQRDIDKLRPRLEKWDALGEQALLQKQKEEEAASPKKKGRLGPESWKLKGAARPAWLVNEMDVRYVCPHQKAHQEASAKAKRIINLLAIYKGKFGQEISTADSSNTDLSYPYRRQFLAYLMQFGLLNMEAKKYKTARLAFLECLDLDGIENPITTARCHLMRLYLQVNRPQSVHQLWTTRLVPAGAEKLEQSVWVLYSVALVEYIRWTTFEEGSRQEAEMALVRAIQGNVFCAYFLAFEEFFHEHMEYTDEVEAAENPLEEAIEYCDSEQMGMWLGTDEALEWLKRTLLRALHGEKVAGGALSAVDLEWAPKLLEVEETFRAQRDAEQMEQEAEQEAEDDAEQDRRVEEALAGKEVVYRNALADEEEEGLEEEPIDTVMYAGMFRTTMDMLYTSGALAHIPPPIENEGENLHIIAEEEENNQSSDDESL